jgi:beta-xylosidase
MATEPALGPVMAVLSEDMLSFEAPPTEIKILDETGNPILAGDESRRFFEAAWVHKYNEKYYLSYSTGSTHLLVYAMSDNIEGPYTYQGQILQPVLGWTSHHSIVEFENQWYLFYHDASLSGGIDYQRSVKYMPLEYNEDGTIKPITP